MRRSLLIASSLALLLVGGAVPATATTPAGIAPSASGWAVVRNPSVASYHPKARDRGNSAGGTVTVNRNGVGSWRVTWTGLSAAGGGDLQVAALNSKMRHCISYTWGADGADGYGEIRCYKRSSVAADNYASPVDSPFAVALVGEDAPVLGAQGRMGYAWMDLYASDGTPDSNYNYANPGGYLTSRHLGTGSYEVTVPGVFKTDGSVLVTGYEGDPSRCQVRGWTASLLGVTATVDCMDLRGIPADEDFDFLYLRHLGLEGYSGGPAAYLWASQPAAASYHPTSSYAWSSNGKAATIKRTSKGVYRVTLPGMPAGGAAIVTAYGPKTTPRNCQLGAIRTIGTPQQIVVRCFTYAGKPADSMFVLSYTH